MKDPKYYLIAKSLYDKYIETQEYDNVYDIVNKPYDFDLDLIIQDHLDTITSLYFDETGLNDSDWNMTLEEIKEMFEESNDKEF